MQPYRDRRDAGRRLAESLAPLELHDPVVIGLPRGGVPVAAEIAERLNAPLDVIVVRKLGVPWQPEVAMGAIGEDGVRVIDETLIARAQVTSHQLDEVERRERAVMDARVATVRRVRPPVELRGRTVVIVDDGIATGATSTAACRVARHRGAASVVLATPVASSDAIAQFHDADRIVCPWVSQSFGAVGAYYLDFSATEDAEVLELLTAAARNARKDEP
ncbi:phosphoribosyltransferase [Lysinimonas soli]|uniref:Phosphoribosyltransferase n=1 Tax=Lysinimonas soli TaxID=1074233 RepID=A0ABW0NSM8_9MICO